MTELTKMLVDVVADNDPEQIERRIRLQMANGIAREHALLIDEAFRRAVEGATRALGEAIDSVPSDLHSVAISYIMRGVNTNLDALENVINQSMIEAALLEGGSIAIVRGGQPADPNCGCPTCTARREAEAQLKNATRH